MPQPAIFPSPTSAPNQGATAELGANWKLQFLQPDGLPLTMSSFEQIDFGAISYKEIFQNVKTILATPLFSCALERTLGVDQSIVDRPIGDAAHVTVAILTAVVYWEPRAEIMNIDFDADVINGHLMVKLQLGIKNVIYGTDTIYPASDIGQPAPDKVDQSLPAIGEPIYVTGPPGATGKRGSLWFTSAGSPDDASILSAQPQDMHLDTATGTVSQLQSPSIGTKKAPAGPPGETGRRASWWYFGTTDPDEIAGSLPYDLFLNTVTGDVWQLGESETWRKITNAKRVD